MRKNLRRKRREINPNSFFSPGNVFVIAAIIIERNLQNVANYLVASLAVADLMVACLVMPLGAVYEVRQYSTLVLSKICFALYLPLVV